MITADPVSVTGIFTKQDMSRWTRAFSQAPGITWTVRPGPGGTMIIIEHACDRRDLPAPGLPAASAGTAAQGGRTAPAGPPAGLALSWCGPSDALPTRTGDGR